MGSNIHSLGDLPPSESYWQQREASSAYLSGSTAPPRCIDLFLPGFTWNSTVLWISFVQIIVYTITLFCGSSGLEPSGSVLSKFGSSYGPFIQNGQVWRLITPIFLHGSIWHILFNVYFQLRMALPLEQAYGKWVMFGIYFFTGVAGSLFSVAVAPCKFAVGASTAGFGLIGIQMAEMALAWHLIANRDQALFNIVLFVVFSIMISVAPNSTIDWRGHMGGFIAGFCCGILLNTKMENQPTWMKSFGVTSAIASLSILYVVCLIVVFAIPMSGAKGRCG